MKLSMGKKAISEWVIIHMMVFFHLKTLRMDKNNLLFLFYILLGI